MIWVIVIIGIVLAVLGAIIVEKTWDLDTVGCFLLLAGGVVAVVSLIAALIIGLCLSNELIIDDRIALYQEENAKIETQISEMVEQYMEYEKDVFMEVAPESSMTLVSLYPELKSDALVEKQLNVYVENNQKIKELKEEKLDYRVLRWWMYFGG
jgi:hypothetical protein